MGIYRMYTGTDNETHIEELPLSAHPELGELQTVKGIQIQQNAGGRFLDFHQAPNKRWMITLSGELEIGLGDGTVHRFPSNTAVDRQRPDDPATGEYDYS